MPVYSTIATWLASVVRDLQINSVITQKGYTVLGHSRLYMDSVLSDAMIVADVVSENSAGAYAEEQASMPEFTVGLAAFCRWNDEADYDDARASVCGIVRTIRIALETPTPGVGSCDSLEVSYEPEEDLSGVRYFAAYMVAKARYIN